MNEKRDVEIHTRSDAKVLLESKRFPERDLLIDDSIDPKSNFPLFFAYLDLYFQELESYTDPRNRTIFEQGRSVVVKGMEKERYQEIRNMVFSHIVGIPGFDLRSIRKLHISQDGIATISQSDNKIHTINLVGLWNTMRLPKDKLESTQKKIREQEERLREEVNTESYFGGSLLVQYAPAVVTGVAIGDMGMYAIKKVFIKMEDGTLKEVGMSGKNIGTKESLGSRILSHLERKGIFFDPIKKVAYDPFWKAFCETRAQIGALTYEKWISMNNGGTREEFTKMIGEIDSMFRTHSQRLTHSRAFVGFQSSVKSLSVRLVKIAGTYAEMGMMAIFFSNFARYQNSVSFFAGVGELAVFGLGAKAGSIVGGLVAGKVGEFIGGLAGGIGGVMGGQKLMEYLDAKRNVWRFGYEKESGMYTDGKSTTLHHVFQWGIPELLDFVNKKTGSNMDIGPKRIENVPIKYFDYRIPEITWFQGKVNFGTSPWEWCRSAQGRTIDDWNKELDNTEVEIAKVITQAAQYYHSNTGPFKYPDLIKEKGGKNGVLTWYLSETISGGGSSQTFDFPKIKLLEYAVKEISSGWKGNSDKKRSTDMIFTIQNCVAYMRIDEDFISDRQFKGDIRKQMIQMDIDRLKLFITEDQLGYISTILDRMIINQDIVTKGYYKETGAKDMFGDKMKMWVKSEELTMFQQLLDDNRTISISSGQQGVSMKVGEYFALLLDQMLEYKRENEFIKELKKGNKKGAKWGI